MTTTTIPAPTARNTFGRCNVNLSHIAERVYGATLTDGGATVSTTAPFAPTPATGYAVALAGREHRVAFDDFRPQDVRDYVSRNRDATTLPGIYVGAWHDVESGDVFLDLSMIVGDLDDALALAREAEQLAIWDFGARAEIRL